MAEYIEREALKKKFCEWCNKEYEDEPCEPDECPLRTMIIEAHAADVVEVVRCGQCKHATEDIIVEGVCYCHKIQQGMFVDGFCCYGERMCDNALKIR